MTLQVIAQWLCTAMSLTGMFLVIFKNRWGFLAWIVSSIGWAITMYIAGVYPRVVLEVVYALQASYAFVAWSRARK